MIQSERTRLLFSENCLNQHQVRRLGSIKFSVDRKIIWRCRVTSELFLPPYGHGSGKLGDITTKIFLANSTALYDLHDQASLSIRQRASVFMIDFLLLQHFSIWRIGFRVQANGGRSVLQITATRRVQVPEIPTWLVCVFRFPSLAFITKKGFTFVYRINGPATTTHRLGVLYAVTRQCSAFLLLVITVYSGR